VTPVAPTSNASDVRYGVLPKIPLELSLASILLGIVFEVYNDNTLALVVCLAVAAVIGVSAVTGIWPSSRTLVVTLADIELRDRQDDARCTRSLILSARIDWTSGTPSQGTRRTRYDPWTLRFLGAAGEELLSVGRGQEFGASKLRSAVGVVGVPLESPPNWEAAQRRWFWFRPPASFG